MTDSAFLVSLRKAVFLDRDGVINRKLPEDAYVRTPSEFQFLPGVFQALSILHDLGFLLVLTTNQRGIARGLMTHKDLETVHGFMQQELGSHGIELDGIYYCPHEKDEHCGCRKPEPGMILGAAKDLGVDMARSYMVGDSPSDINAGRRAGVRTVRIGAEEDREADLSFSDLLEFALFAKESCRKE